MFTRRGFLGTALASLLALVGFKRLEAAPKAVQTPPPKAPEVDSAADTPHDLFVHFRIERCGIMLGNIGILAEGVSFERSVPFHGKAEGFGSIRRLIGPASLVEEFLRRCTLESVEGSGSLHLRLFKPGNIDLVLDKVLVTSIGMSIIGDGMRVIDSVFQGPEHGGPNHTNAISFIGGDMLKMDVPSGPQTVQRCIVVPKGCPVRFEHEVVVESADLLQSFHTSPAKLPY